MDVVLKPGRETSLLQRHPWVFSGAIQAVTGTPALGETVDLVTPRGEWLARGAYSPHSQIRVRVWTFEDEPVDAAFFERRLRRALELRRELGFAQPGRAFRLVNAENDGLPGVVIDRYADHFVGQFLSAGAEASKREIVAAAQAVLPAAGFFERSDVEVREKEGLQPVSGVLAGVEPPEFIEIDNGGVRLLVDVRKGHKTGAYLDQSENRRLVGEVARGEVLNVFCYTGGFGLHASARVTQLDQSADALALAMRNAELNGRTNIEYLQGNAFEELRKLREVGRQFDCVVLDPPKFASSAQHVEKAAAAYKDINLLGSQLLKPGGWLFTFSCSGHISRELFQAVVADAATDAGRDATIVRHLTQSPDHPVGLCYPEGLYLKGFQVRV